MVKIFAIILTMVMILVAASPLTQTVSATPYTGPEPTPTNVTFYLHNVSRPIYVGSTPALNVLNTVNDTNVTYIKTGKLVTGLHYISVQFYIVPQLASNLTINGTPELYLYLNQTGSSSGGSISYTLYSLNPNGTTSIIGTSAPYALSNVKYGSTPNLNLISFGSKLLYTIPKNNSLELSITISGASSNYYGIWWGLVSHTYYYSALDLPVSNYLNVENISTFVNGNLTSVFPSTGNKTVKIIANITDPLGIYDFNSYPVNLEISNLSGTIFSTGMKPLNNPLESSYYQLFYAYYNYSGLPPGRYEISVNATDNTYHNLINQNTGSSYYGRNAFGVAYFWIGGRPVNVQFRVVDTLNNSVQNATVKIYSITSYIGKNSTNSSGIASFELSANSSYVAKVFYENSPVGVFPFNTSGSNESFSLSALIYYPTFKILDNASQPLGNALIYAINPGGLHYPLLVTSKNGTASLKQVPGGNYYLNILWHDTLVFNGSIPLNSNRIIPINVSVYEQSIYVSYPQLGAIDLAYIEIYNITTGNIIGFNNTNINGFSQIPIPVGSYGITVFWKTFTIFSGLVQEPSNATLHITAELYNFTMTTLDYSNLPIAGVVIDIYENNTLVSTTISGNNGNSSVVLGKGAYSMQFYYMGYNVGQAQISINSNTSMSYALSIYSINLTTFDTRNATIGDIQLKIYNPSDPQYQISVVTNVEGNAQAILPAGIFDYEAYYLGTDVASGSFTVTGQNSIPIPTMVYYVNIKILTNSGQPLSGTFVEVWHDGMLVGSGLTNKSGIVTFRLPAGNYTMEAYYSGTYMLTPEKQSIIEPLNVMGSQTMAFKLSGINLPFYDTYAFYLALIFVIIIAAFVFAIRRMGKR